MLEDIEEKECRLEELIELLRQAVSRPPNVNVQAPDVVVKGDDKPMPPIEFKVKRDHHGRIDTVIAKPLTHARQY